LSETLQRIGESLRTSLEALTKGFRDGSHADGSSGVIKMHVTQPLFATGPVVGANLGDASSFLNEDPIPMPAPQVVAIRIGDD